MLLLACSPWYHYHIKVFEYLDCMHGNVCVYALSNLSAQTWLSYWIYICLLMYVMTSWHWNSGFCTVIHSVPSPLTKRNQDMHFSHFHRWLGSNSAAEWVSRMLQLRWWQRQWQQEKAVVRQLQCVTCNTTHTFSSSPTTNSTHTIHNKTSRICLWFVAVEVYFLVWCQQKWWSWLMVSVTVSFRKDQSAGGANGVTWEVMRKEHGFVATSVAWPFVHPASASITQNPRSKEAACSHQSAHQLRYPLRARSTRMLVGCRYTSKLFSHPSSKPPIHECT